MAWTVYLAGPIDQVQEDEKLRQKLHDERTQLREGLQAVGASVYDPASSWAVLHGRGSPAIQRINDAAIESCDGMLAYLPDGVGTIGVPMELERAIALGKPAVVYGGSVAGTSTVISARGVPVYANRADAIAELEALIFTPLEDEEMSVHDRFLLATLNEIDRAEKLHPSNPTHTPAKWLGIWMEEVFEAIQAWNDDQGHEAVCRELVQVAAMTTRFWASMQPEQAPSWTADIESAAEAARRGPFDHRQLTPFPADLDQGPRPIPAGMIHDTARERE